MGTMLGAGLLEEKGWARSPLSCGPVVDMPVSVAVGSVRTPEFTVKHEGYQISIRAKKNFPFDEMNCMLGLSPMEPIGSGNCDKEPLLNLTWIVWDQGRTVAQGLVHGWSGYGGWADKSIDRYLGHFVGEAKKKYVLELTFTKDGGALKQTEPRLVVEQDPNFWCWAG
jgi:hypothetical protein